MGEEAGTDTHPVYQESKYCNAVKNYFFFYASAVCFTNTSKFKNIIKYIHSSDIPSGHLAIKAKCTLRAAEVC